ncbi:MAG: alpha/beta fold hydrolase [Rhodospirillales bacterium]|jgi:pimeloyl-ACP methyl ester carboxylesterase|nr:alpha/beta fold hydrolase [Rhodospirillales bacterium]MDP6644083.1 alpha/beta fold hydrolase [Rhodospirillales bacterium]MDP6841135.1 alpha/beta fold hydrolase [Rhodospirillales bacterium]|tara:strand:+ start:2156 stop:3025 length:870 start_codon:yes stop_codon:yes gene_type:complete
MIVDLVSVETSDGVTLDGSFRRPEEGTRSNLPIDCMIMHHGIGGSFYDAHFHEVMAENFLARGVAVLRVNNRGHDLAYNAPPHGRLGGAFESVDDCRKDWKTWIDFAESQGCERIGLWGHSLGAVKTIYFMAMENDARVKRVIASSPPRFSGSDYLARPDGGIFGAEVEYVRKLADAGDMEALFTITVPTPTLMTAGTFLDKYGPEERYDILRHLPDVSGPILITIGGLEGNRPEFADRFGFGGLAGKISEFAENSGNVSFNLIDGGDHFYTGLTDELWSVAEAWLAKT